MAIEVKGDAEPSMTSLVGAIFSDAEKLIEQQFALFRREVEGEIRRAKTAATSLALGAGIGAAGAFMLLFMFVYIILAHTTIPLWGCFGLVGGLLVGIGALFLYRGGKEASHVHLTAPPQTTETLKENVEWLTNQPTSKPT